MKFFNFKIIVVVFSSVQSSVKKSKQGRRDVKQPAATSFNMDIDESNLDAKSSAKQERTRRREKALDSGGYCMITKL